MQEGGYSWWIDRIRHNLGLYDLLRIDHFRGFVAYWEIPANDKTAEKGKWVEVPAYDFWRRMFQSIPDAALVAEDLGTITPDVMGVIKKHHFTTMKGASIIRVMSMETGTGVSGGTMQRPGIGSSFDSLP